MPRRVLDYPSAFGGWHSVITAGHMLSVAGLISFFIMIFDSLRQSKAATRNNFGIMRYKYTFKFLLVRNSSNFIYTTSWFSSLSLLSPYIVKIKWTKLY